MLSRHRKALALAGLVCLVAAILTGVITRPWESDGRDESDDALIQCERMPAGSQAQRACARKAFLALQAEVLRNRRAAADSANTHVFARMNKAILLAVGPGQQPGDVLQIDPRLTRLGFATTTWQMGGDKATLATFAGTWQAHARTLTISRTGNGKEWISFGLGHFVIALRFHLSQPTGTPDDATAKATVTAVRLGKASTFTAARPAPRVGESRRIRLRNGVITGLTGDHYCGATAGDWLDAGCGA